MENLERARTLRGHQTEAEQRLWYQLRAHRFLGSKFKRQKPIHPYIVDFICIEYRLVIEADGGQHSASAIHDQRTYPLLENQGFAVLRFWNNHIMNNLPAVLDAIRVAVEEKHPYPPAPLPPAGEGSTPGGLA